MDITESVNRCLHSGCGKQPWFKPPGVQILPASIVVSQTNMPTGLEEYVHFGKREQRKGVWLSKI